MAREEYVSIVFSDVCEPLRIEMQRHAEVLSLRYWVPENTMLEWIPTHLWTEIVKMATQDLPLPYGYEIY